MLIWARQIIDAWVGPGLYLGAAFVFVLVLISSYEILYQSLRPIALCSSDESIFNMFSWQLPLSYILIAIPCFVAAKIWEEALFLVLLPTFVTSALVLVPRIYKKLQARHPHRLFVLGARAVGGYIAIMVGAVVLEWTYSEQAMLPRLLLSLILVTFSIGAVVHALGITGAKRSSALLLGLSR